MFSSLHGSNRLVCLSVSKHNQNKCSTAMICSGQITSHTIHNSDFPPPAACPPLFGITGTRCEPKKCWAKWGKDLFPSYLHAFVDAMQHPVDFPCWNRTLVTPSSWVLPRSPRSLSKKVPFHTAGPCAAQIFPNTGP